jgi:hypothetical protein
MMEKSASRAHWTRRCDFTGTEELPATPAGYAAPLGRMRGFGQLTVAAIEDVHVAGMRTLRC